MPRQAKNKEAGTSTEDWSLRAHRFATAVGVLCAISGVLVLLGWHFEIAWLYRVSPGFLPMAPNSAAAYIAAGIALVLVTRGPLAGLRRIAVIVLAVFVGAIGLITTAEYLTVQDLGIDRLVISPAEFAVRPDLRPSFNAAVAWILLAFALPLVDYTPRRGHRPASWLAMTSAFSAVVALAGYLYGAAPRFGIPGYLPATGLALHSAALLLLLSIAVVAARPRLGMMAVFTSTDSGGFMARRFLLGAAAFPLAGFVVSLGVRFGWFDERLAESLLAGLGVVVATALIVRVGCELNQADVERRDALGELRDTENQQRYLAQLAGELSESLSLCQTLDTLARRIVPDVCDWCVVELTGASGEVQHAAIRHRSPALQAEADALLRSVTGTTLPDNLAEALRADRPTLMRDLDETKLAARVHDAERRRRYQTLGMRTYIVIPLRARGRLVGSLSLVCASRNFSDGDYAFALEIGRQAAVFADNARLYEEAQRAVRTREDVLAIVSHDLQNPLNAIRLGTAVLARKIALDGSAGPASREQLLRNVASLSRSADRAFKLISDLLDFAKFEAGTWQISPQAERASELLDDLGELMRPQAKASETLLELAADDELLVRCERSRVLQVLANLVSNAIKFQAHGGSVKVCARRGPEGLALFSVQDRGPGIASADLPHIFDRYWQPEGTRRQGTGLGLAIARHIVDAHGGRIWVESRPGEGSTFFFTLPLTDVTPELRRPKAEKTPDAGEPSRP